MKNSKYFTHKNNTIRTNGGGFNFILSSLKKFIYFLE